MHIYMHVDMCACPHTRSCLYVYGLWFQGWLHWIGQATQGSLWKKSWFFVSLQSLVPCRSLSRGWSQRKCPSSLWICLQIAIVPVLFVQPFLGETASEQNSQYSDSYSPSTPSSTMFPESLMGVGDVVPMYLLELGSHSLLISASHPVKLSLRNGC